MIKFMKSTRGFLRNGVATLIFTVLFIGVLSHPRIASAGIASVGPGTAPGTVSLKLSPFKASNTFVYVENTTPGIWPRAKLGVAPSGFNPAVTPVNQYRIGSNITPRAGYPILEVYELDENGNTVAFKELKILSTNVAVQAIPISSINIGLLAGSTRATLTNAGTYNVQVVSKITTPLPASGSIPKGNRYASGTDITGVDPVKNKYIDIYQLDASGKTIGFKEVLLRESNISAQPLKKSSATPGTSDLTTAINVTAAKSGNQFYYLQSADGCYPPASGTDVLALIVPDKNQINTSINFNSLTQFTSGTDITWETPALLSTISSSGTPPLLGTPLLLGAPAYLDVFEVDDTMSVVGFKEYKITNSDQAAPVALVNAINPSGTSSASSAKLNVPLANWPSYKVSVSSKKTSILPAYLSPAKGTTYNGSISGVDAIKNKYVGIYQVDNFGNTLAFKEIALVSTDLTAPNLKSATVSPGTAPSSTKLKLSAMKAGNSFYYAPSVVAFPPVLGQMLSNFVSINSVTSYASGNNIAVGAGAIDVYEVDVDGYIVAYSKLTITAREVAAPTIGIGGADATPGDKPGSTKLRLPQITTVGNSYKIVVSSKALTAYPIIGEEAKGREYIIGFNSTPAVPIYQIGASIMGLDPVKNRYLDIYEIDSNNKVVRFQELTLDSSNMAAPDLK